jgi:hypothetical protein
VRKKAIRFANFMKHADRDATGVLEDFSDLTNLSRGRFSEYPTDYIVGICIETSAMAEQNTLRLP